VASTSDPRTDPAQAPFGEHIRLDGQGLEHRPVELLEQLTARHAEPLDRPLIIEPDQELSDRRVQFREAVETPVPQAPENPTFHDRAAASAFTTKDFVCQHGKALLTLVFRDVAGVLYNDA
jgi:hypothetical protein